MADFMKRKISTDSYEFPEGALKIYGGGKFYNGFGIGDTTKLSVVNEDGLLKFSRDTAGQNVKTSVILGIIPPTDNTTYLYIDVAEPASTVRANVYVNGVNILSSSWSSARIYQTDGDTASLRAGGELQIAFMYYEALPAIPNLCAVRAIWIK